MKHIVEVHVRKLGAIGIFVTRTFEIEAESKQLAKEQVWERLKETHEFNWIHVMRSYEVDSL
jgi:hypothetical protein